MKTTFGAKISVILVYIYYSVYNFFVKNVKKKKLSLQFSKKLWNKYKVSWEQEIKVVDSSNCHIWKQLLEQKYMWNWKKKSINEMRIAQKVIMHYLVELRYSKNKKL